jgi:hypothetical protein
MAASMAARHSSTSKRLLRDQHGARRLVEAMVGAADALDKAARTLRRADIDDQIDVAPVDAEIERGSGQPPPSACRPPSRGFHLAAARRIEASRDAGQSAGCRR